jgi:ATP-binding protein involved in chromosome partitioning
MSASAPAHKRLLRANRSHNDPIFIDLHLMSEEKLYGIHQIRKSAAPSVAGSCASGSPCHCGAPSQHVPDRSLEAPPPEAGSARAPGERAFAPGVRNIIAVSSGKGGVGKSTVAVNIAVSLALDGARVGLLDADVYGPDVPLMLGAGRLRPELEANKILPLEAHGVSLMSMAVLKPGDQPMILRGPIIHGLIRQFLSDVKWGDLDYLIVDMPPGTGDVQLSLAQLVRVQGAVLVTTPQEAALIDVRRALRMFQAVGVPVLGVVENMSYFEAPDTGVRYHIFGEGGGRKLAQIYAVPLLGEVPLGMELREGGDNGMPVVIGQPASPQAAALRQIAREVARQVSTSVVEAEKVNLSF